MERLSDPRDRPEKTVRLRAASRITDAVRSLAVRQPAPVIPGDRPTKLPARSDMTWKHARGVIHLTRHGGVMEGARTVTEAALRVGVASRRGCLHAIAIRAVARGRSGCREPARSLLRGFRRR